MLLHQGVVLKKLQYDFCSQLYLVLEKLFWIHEELFAATWNHGTAELFFPCMHIGTSMIIGHFLFIQGFEK